MKVMKNRLKKLPNNDLLAGGVLIRSSHSLMSYMALKLMSHVALGSEMV
jgi:hypothetical protein